MEYQLKYQLKVHDSKYRELLNILESNCNKQKPDKCTTRIALQSINDMNIFEYFEVWANIESLKEYMNTNEFKSLLGAFQLLTLIKDFSITKSISQEETLLLYDK